MEIHSPARLDNIFGSVTNNHEAVGVHSGHITGIKPAIISECGLVFPEITFHNPMAADLQISLGFPIVGKALPVFIHQTQADTIRRPPLPLAQLRFLVVT